VIGTKTPASKAAATKAKRKEGDLKVAATRDERRAQRCCAPYVKRRVEPRFVTSGGQESGVFVTHDYYL
jgi:hypothetical protein